MDHELKIWPQFYQAVANGSKTFEVRENDRGFQKGDTVTLREWDPAPKNPNDKSIPKGYTASEPLKFEVGYVFVLDKSKVIFSLLPLKKPKVSAQKKT